MDTKIIDVTKNKLAERIAEYVDVIIKEYGSCIPKDRYEMLVNTNNFRDYVHIEDIGTISLYVKDGHFYFPLGAYKLINAMSKIVGYGSRCDHKTYTKDTLINNDNTFVDYMRHIFLAGKNTDEYYEEILLHETMHFCGSNGGSALMEGINELKTRELALKYNLVTNGYGYPKEVKIALMLQELLGKEVMDKIAFSKNGREIYNILANVSDAAVDLFFEVQRVMELEFYQKYYKYKFPGLLGPIKKNAKYMQLDYSKVYEIIENYKSNKTK